MWEFLELINDVKLGRLLAVWVVGVGVFLIGPATLRAQPAGVTGYEAVPVGNSAQQLDEFGRVIGDLGGPLAQATVWVNGKIIELPTPNGLRWAYEVGISPTSGVVVGGTRDLNQPIVWTAQRIFFLEKLEGGHCSAAAVNDAGWAVGFCSGVNKAALWIKGGDPIDLGHLGGGRSSARDINTKNEIVGWSWPNWINDGVPFLWRDGEMFDLFAVAGKNEWRGFTRSINNHSEIVGEIVNLRGAFYWLEGELTVLPERGDCGFSYHARAINDTGLIVGDSYVDGCEESKALIWDRSRDFESYVIDDYLRGPSDFSILWATDINNAGQMSAAGIFGNGEGGGYLVTPYRFELNEPVPGVAGEVNVIRVTGLDEGQRVQLFFGTKAGAQPIGNGCLGGLVLIRDANTHKSLEAFGDVDGNAEFRVLVPGGVRGKSVRYQVVGPDECEISHTVEFLFE